MFHRMGLLVQKTWERMQAKKKYSRINGLFNKDDLTICIKSTQTPDDMYIYLDQTKIFPVALDPKNGFKND